MFYYTGKTGGWQIILRQDRKRPDRFADNLLVAWVQLKICQV
jgi:hypothetical protein